MTGNEIDEVITDSLKFVRTLVEPKEKSVKKNMQPENTKDDAIEDNRQAIGCLHELVVIVTSCLNKNASVDAQKQAHCVLESILSTGLVKKKPMYYRFDWEQALYERYLDNA